jgi:hypothetical protein
MKADTKYKEMEYNARPPHEHTMQVHSYSRVTKAKKCILIYPSMRNIEKKEYPLLPFDIRLFVLHFNLACHSKQEFDQNCSNFTNQVNNILLA